MRHNELRNLTAKLLKEVCKDVATEPLLTPLTVTLTIAKRFANQNLHKAYETNEKEKKKAYNERVMEVEHGTFTPLIFAATGGMGRECSKFFTQLAETIADKRNGGRRLPRYDGRYRSRYVAL